MIVYHGSNVEVGKPRLIVSNRALKIRKLYNQLVFASDKALGFIRFLRSEVVS